METAVIGGGCFWCLEAVYRGMRGIHTIMPGYAGGHVDHPSYKQVCTGETGHAEVIALTWDPAVLSYEDILRVFFVMHDPTTLNRQGADIGTQYRSVIFYTTEQQHQTALAVKADITHAKLWPRPPVTEITALPVFWPADESHHDYYARHPGAGYCQVVISPKVAKVRAEFSRYFD
ncbi:MAG: peptide-methionine (S)-S-oxide reductase MsrA [Acetobacter sp.]|uniref:peptide-methionine (S)-S-oxide reductase MsrA n=1 Tax=Acetobacter sp. TaxID=440 RepID=UPI0039E96B7D